jgi:DNA-damage-inducible protein D
MTTHVALFQDREVRKTLHKDEWWFVVQDVVVVLTDSADPKQYIARMRERDPELEKGYVQIVTAVSGKFRSS